MERQFFSDGVGAISIIGGTVRLDLVTYSPTEKDPEGKPAVVFQQRIVMGVDSFLRSATQIHEVAEKLATGPVPVATRGDTDRAAEPSSVPEATPNNQAPFP